MLHNSRTIHFSTYAQQSLCSCIPVVAAVVELCDQVTLLLVVASWHYSYLVKADPGVSNALSCFESRHVRITSWGAVNVYAHVTSREHREDKRTTRPDTYIHIYKHSPRRGTHITINVGLAQAHPNKVFHNIHFLGFSAFSTMGT